DAVDGEGCFRDVRGQHDSAPSRGFESEGLLVGGKAAMKGEEERIVLLCERFEAMHCAIDFRRAGKEGEDIASNYCATGGLAASVAPRKSTGGRATSGTGSVVNMGS